MAFRVLPQALLAHYNSWRTGGACELLYQPQSISELAEFLANRDSDQPIRWLGLGSNVLIRDAGFKGIVIHTQAGLQEISHQANRVRVLAGVPCAKLAKYCAKYSFEGGAFFAGIPGTVGGALAMNAGAFGSETWNYCIAAETMDSDGKLHYRSKKEFEIAYREVKGQPDEWFVAGIFEFGPGDSEVIKRQIKELLHKRAQTQPVGTFNCGSVFRNPPGNYAARLIENCGLKGYRMGDAIVSEKHANFIINQGQATAADIENLIEKIQTEVFQQTGFFLIRECHIIGDK